jgi:hypothetical protein
VPAGQERCAAIDAGKDEIAVAARMPGDGPRRGRAAQARAQRRGELLVPGAPVTVSGERRTADIDDVFTTLDNELVGLLPVKQKVEEIASLLLVDRGPAAVRP